MTDRELLLLAAKAAGIKIDKSTSNGGGLHNTGFDCRGNIVTDWHNDKKWNPLTDDGDALRLAVMLLLGIEQQHDCVYANGFDPSGFDPIQNYQLLGWHKDDRAVATRRAIVTAAAEIGKVMT